MLLVFAWLIKLSTHIFFFIPCFSCLCFPFKKFISLFGLFCWYSSINLICLFLMILMSENYSPYLTLAIYQIFIWLKGFTCFYHVFPGKVKTDRLILVTWPIKCWSVHTNMVACTICSLLINILNRYQNQDIRWCENCDLRFTTCWLWYACVKYMFLITVQCYK